MQQVHQQLLALLLHALPGILAVPAHVAGLDPWARLQKSVPGDMLLSIKAGCLQKHFQRRWWAVNSWNAECC